MSETILDHGYVPEEHAPDPVIGHGDPTPPGKVAIWLFLASEIMFFIAILATYIIFRSGSPKIFAEHAHSLSKPLAGVNTLVLIFSSLTMALAVDASQKGNRTRTIVCLAITLLCACGFMGIKTIEYNTKLTHHTIVTTEVDAATKKATTYVYDGHIRHWDNAAPTVDLVGFRAARPNDNEPFDIHWMSEKHVEELSQGVPAEAARVDAAERHAPLETPRKIEKSEGEPYQIDKAKISQDITYGPWKNIFFACYFTLTGIHGIHVLGGMVALTLLLVHAIRGKLLPPHTEYIGLYWHFVDLVCIFLFPLLYLI